MTIHKNPLVKPFVKWAGGKRQLLPEIKRYLPSKIKDYYEPFVGGGAVFLDIQCPHPVINDFNDELINTYLVVRDDVDSLIHLLKKHELNNSSDYYYQMRAWDRTGELQKRSNTERAARFIYLNKTGFNGLFRVNSQGQINVPYGRYKNPAIVNEEVLHAVSLYMNEGSGVAYMVSADAGYTLKQVNGENIYYLFSNGKKLGSVTMKQMVDYLNKRDSDSLVNSLAQNAKVNDERSDSGDDSSDSAGKKSNLPGDDGLFNVPTEFQGTWYTYNDDKMSIIKISQNKINVDNYVQELHKVKAGFLDKYTYGDMSASYHKATKNWGMAGMGSQRVHGINYMNVRGWMQEAGDGDFYGLHTENGQSVLVLAQGAGPWVSGVAWKTPQLAQQYKHKKFKDLYYQDDQ